MIHKNEPAAWAAAKSAISAILRHDACPALLGLYAEMAADFGVPTLRDLGDFMISLDKVRDDPLTPAEHVARCEAALSVLGLYRYCIDAAFNLA